jgi:glycosyltransferase involved in cell wall biosynthesis
VTLFCAVEPVDHSLKQPNLRVIHTGQLEIRSDPHRLRAAGQGLWNRKAARTLSSLLNECDPGNTIVHVHGWTKALSPAVLHEAISRGFKVVITLHDYFLACPNGGFFDYQAQQICHRQPLSIGCMTTDCDTSGYRHKLWRIERQFVQRDLSNSPRGVRHFISVSQFSLDVMRPFLPENCTIYPVPNPVEAIQEPAAAVDRNPGFLFVGRISQEKGVLSLVGAAKRAGVQITLVGDGGWRDKCAERNPDARFTGWLSPEEVREQMRKARALIFPSLWYETQGLVVLEAAALGLPSIVSDVTAARGMVDGGVTGLWFRGGDEEDLAAKMELLQDAGTCTRLGAAAYEKYWAQPFTMSRHVAALESCYEKMLSS